MTTINDFLASRPTLTAGILTHLWQSSAVGMVILGLLLLGGRLSARTRRALAGMALAKFALPVAPLVAGATPLTSWLGGGITIDRLRLPALLQTVLPPTGDGAVPAWSGGVTAREFWIVAGFLWAAGFAFLIGFWAFRARRLRRRLLGAAAPLPGPLLESVLAAARKTGLSAPPRCLSVEMDHGPGVLGVLAPIVLLPRGIEETLLPDELEAILVHEFVHVRRRDPWWNFVQMLLVSAFWFDPVTWLLQRRLKIEAEKSCDDRVLAITADPGTYARGIVKTVRFSLGLPQIGWASAAMPPVASRLKEILSQARRPERQFLRVAALGAGIALLAFSGCVGSIVSKPASIPAAVPASDQPPPPAAADTHVYAIGEVDQKPVPIFNPRPLYPYDMRKQGLSGQVTVEFVLNTEGIVQSAFAASSTQREFEAAAVQAVSHWRFRPARKNGRAVNVSMQVPIYFSINSESVAPATKPTGNRSAVPTPPAPVAQEVRAPAVVGAVTIPASAAPAPAAPATVAGDNNPRSSASIVASASPPADSSQIFDPGMLDKQPVAIHQPAPKYPFDMKKQGFGGEVLVEFILDRSGVVQNAHAMRSTRRQFENSAVSAVSKWQFRPGQKGGMPVNTRMRVPIVFSVDPRG